MYRLMTAEEVLVPDQYFDDIAEAEDAAAASGVPFVVKVVTVRELPALFTREQREKLSSRIDFREYADCVLCGDGLEIETAMADFHDMPDADLVFMGLMPQYDRADVEGMLREVGIAIDEFVTEFLDNCYEGHGGLPGEER